MLKALLVHVALLSTISLASEILHGKIHETYVGPALGEDINFIYSSDKTKQVSHHKDEAKRAFDAEINPTFEDELRQSLAI